MTPDISTRLAAASPSPDNASTAGSRCAPVVYSPGPSLFCPVPPDGGTPTFLAPNSSAPCTPGPTHSKKAVHRRHRGPEHAPNHDHHDNAARISRIKRYHSRLPRLPKKKKIPWAM